MPFAIRTNGQELVLELSGSVTVRHAQELGNCLGAAFSSGTTVKVESACLEDIDTSILQLLCSIRKTARAFSLPDPPEAFVSAVDRCALRRELLGGSRENL